MSEEEKTEDPTSKRLSKARGEGNVPKSAEVVGAAILLFGTVYMLFWSTYTYDSIKRIMIYIFNQIGKELNGTDYYNIVDTIIHQTFYALAPFFLAVLILAVVLNVAQFGFLMNPIKIKFSKLNPISGIKGLFSLKKLLEGVKLLAKLSLIVFVMFILFGLTYKAFLAMMDQDISTSLDAMFFLLLYFLQAILFIVIIFAIIDFFFMKHYYTKSLKMSKQEVQDEHKNMEGDPKVKAKIRNIQFQLHFERMRANAKDADVVITNPTHYSVGLKYDSGVDAAPKIVAKGIDFLALKIRDIARDNDIPIIENPSLARALYDQIAVDQEIPSEFYKAMAEVFSYVHELNKNKR
ncbi:MAG: flagellar biosynthesis protein FlhB [Arcobacter sp.]|uniref:flagellar biosynthesis protein FlhB n=1 Tax=uncultured Arcobacter sp. TaxID=165434 RepID=UPI000CAD6FD3|nr:flagellar biosynthesis protein FlhB [uncultured Arcobacter sp.]PLY10407.1 MAG: flagellar biosynthesis protein FlhB [Arcobacter sp.]